MLDVAYCCSCSVVCRAAVETGFLSPYTPDTHAHGDPHIHGRPGGLSFSRSLTCVEHAGKCRALQKTDGSIAMSSGVGADSRELKEPLDWDAYWRHLANTADPFVRRRRRRCRLSLPLPPQQTHTRLTALIRDYPGEPVPER